MKPKISSGYLTPQNKKIKKITNNLSDAKEKRSSNNDPSNIDNDLFKSLMKDPQKKNMILQLLALNKEAIKDYQDKEIKNSPGSVDKFKKKVACESPSALYRRRALEQITKSSDSFSSTSKGSSGASIVSPSPVPEDKVFQGVVAFVEVISNGQDRSEGVKSILRSMGATVKDRMSSDVTHVIFKGGSFTTYNKANLIKAHIVSVLWVEFSRKARVKQNEKLYHAIKNRLYDDESSLVCSQIEKEYEELIREEYRKSIIDGTPLPTTATLINRRRTLLNPSVSSSVGNTSFHTAKCDSSQNKNNEKENTDLQGIELLENKNSSDMELTMISEQTNDKKEINTNKKVSVNSPQKSNSNVTLRLRLEKRKTICSISTESDRTPSGIIEIDTSVQPVNSSTYLNSSNESIVFGKNSIKAKINSGKTKKVPLPLKESSSVMSQLHVSSENVEKKEDEQGSSSMSNLFVSSEKNVSSSKTDMASNSLGKKLRSSSSFNKSAVLAESVVQKSSSSMSNLQVSSEKKLSSITNIGSNSLGRKLRCSSSFIKSSVPAGSVAQKSSSSMSTLNLSSAFIQDKETTKQSISLMSKLQISSERDYSNVLPEKNVFSGHNVASTNEKPSSSTMSNLEISSEHTNGSSMAALQLSKDVQPHPTFNTRSRRSTMFSVNNNISLSIDGNSFGSNDWNSSKSLSNVISNVINDLESSKETESNTDDSEIFSPKKIRRSLFPTTPGSKNQMKPMKSNADTSGGIIKRKRKLYDPDDNVVLQMNDEEERAIRRVEFVKKKEAPAVNISSSSSTNSSGTDCEDEDYEPKKVTNSNSIKKGQKKSIALNTSKKDMSTTSDDDDESLIKTKKTRRVKKTFQKPIVDVNSSDDEQRDLLKEVEAQKLPSVQSGNITRRRSTRLLNPVRMSVLEDTCSTPKKNRRSTMDFQPVTQRSTAKKFRSNINKLPTIVCTKLHTSEVQTFRSAVKTLGRFCAENAVNNNTTHLVAGEPKRTINMMKAIARGCWILKYDWVLKSLEKGKWLAEEDFEVLDFAPIVQKSRLQRQAFGPKYSLDVFENCQPIFISAHSNPKCEDLCELVTLCKGHVVNTKRKARIVVGEGGSDEDITYVSETWLLDCITKNRKLPFKQKYLIRDRRRVSLAV